MQKAFFDLVRERFGSLSQSQVDGINMIGSATSDLSAKHRAYIIATAWHETGHTMQPVEEIGKGVGRAYGHPDGPWHMVYDGRGLVQLTWLRNYVLATTKLKARGVLNSGEDLAATPDLAMRPDIAAAILRYGMEEGWFTGKKLSDYTDYLNMRRVVNGTDRNDLIAAFAFKFEDALKAEIQAPTPSPDVPQASVVASKPIPGPPAKVPAQPYTVNLLTIIIDLIVTLMKGFKHA